MGKSNFFSPTHNCNWYNMNIGNVLGDEDFRN